MGYRENKKAPKWKKPQRPAVDRAGFEVLHAIAGRSASEVARNTYVSATTIRNWRNMKTRWPQFHTLNAVAKVAGLKFALVPDDPQPKTKKGK